MLIIWILFSHACVCRLSNLKWHYFLSIRWFFFFVCLSESVANLWISLNRIWFLVFIVFSHECMNFVMSCSFGVSKIVAGKGDVDIVNTRGAYRLSVKIWYKSCVNGWCLQWKWQQHIKILATFYQSDGNMEREEVWERERGREQKTTNFTSPIINSSGTKSGKMLCVCMHQLAGDSEHVIHNNVYIVAVNESLFNIIYVA